MRRVQFSIHQSKGSFSSFFFFRTVAKFNILNIRTLVVHAGLPWCFHNPPNSDMFCRIFNVSHLSAYVYTRGTSVYNLFRRTFVESAQNLTPEKFQGGRKASHVTVTEPFGDHAPSCVTFAFENECSCSAPLTVHKGFHSVPRYTLEGLMTAFQSVCELPLSPRNQTYPDDN